MALTKAPDIAEAEPPLPPTSQPKGRWVTPAGGRQLPRWGPEMRACLHHRASLWEGTRGREAAKPRKKHGHSQEQTTAPQLPARGPGTQSGWGPRAARSAGRREARRGTGDTVTSAIRGQLGAAVLKHGCTFGSLGELGANVDAQATPQAG